jgi:hypothetical protein
MQPPCVVFAPPSVQGPRRAVNVAQLERDRDLRGLVRALEDTCADGAIKANVAGALGNLMIADNENRAAVLAVGAIPPLVELLRGSSDQGKAETAGALRNITGGNDANKAAVSAAGAILPACGVAVQWGVYGGEEERRGGAVQPHIPRRGVAPCFRTRVHPRSTRSVDALSRRECIT